jgi:TolB protein
MIAAQPRFSPGRVVASLALTTWAACGLLALAALGLWPKDARLIAFVSYQDGNREIYVVDAGALVFRPVRVTDNVAPDSDPVWSPDGRHLAFVSTRDGDHDIFITDLDGSWVMQVTHNDVLDWRPAWSPDGTRLLFESELDKNFEIYVAGVDLAACDLQAPACISAPIRLTDHPAVDSYPTWSPDGRQIAFQSNRDGNFDIFVVPVIGPGLVGPAPGERLEPLNLTRDPAGDWFPAWSPDGRYLAFESDRDHNREIYILDLEAGLDPPIRLTAHTATDTAPRWSPDGQSILFVSNRSHDDEIYLAAFDGQPARTIRNLTNRPGSERNPLWSPDGRQIAFESYGQGSDGIFIMKSDGTEQTQITFSSRGDRQIAWRP